GIGANSAIFSVVDALVLRPLPFPRPEQLVAVTCGRDGRGVASLPDFRDWRAQSKTMAKLAAWRDDDFILTGRQQPALLHRVSDSADLFAVAGVAPLLGRSFGAGEDVAGKNHVAVIAWSLWQKQFGGEADVLEQTLTLDGEPYSIIGVMPRNFRFPFGE